MEGIQRHYSFLIMVFIVTYLFVHPLIAACILAVSLCYNPLLIYGVMILSPLFENMFLLGPSFTINKLIIFLYMCTFFVSYFFSTERKKIPFFTPLVLLFMYMTLIIMGMFVAFNNEELILYSGKDGLLTDGINSLLKVITGFILCVDFANKEKEEIKNLVRNIGIAVIPGVIIISTYNVYHFTEEYGSGVLRRIFAGSDPNDYACSIAVIGLFLLYQLANGSKWYIKIGSVIGLGFVVFIVLRTVSRAGLLSLLFVFLISFLFIFSKVKQKIWFGIGVLCGAIALFYVNPELYLNLINRFLNDSHSVSSLTNGRYDIWLESIQKTFEVNPIVGLGLAVDTEIYASGINVAHNTFLAIFIKLGFAGLLIYTSLLVFTISEYTRFFQLGSEFKLLLFMLIAIVFSSLSLSWDGNDQLWNFIGINSGILYSVISGRFKREEDEYEDQDYDYSA